MRGMERWEFIAIVVLSLAAFVLMVFPFVKDLNSEVVPISLTYDNFYHPEMAKAVYDTHQHNVYSPSRAIGSPNALIGDPPLPYSIPATVSMVTGVPVYNMFAILVALFQIFMCLGVYAIARRHFNPAMAIFALAIALIPATYAWLFQYIIGFSTSLEAFAFAPLILFLTLYLYDQKSLLASVLIGAALSVQLMIHGPIECGYIYVFISAAMGVMWWRTRKPWLVKSWLAMSASAAILGGYQYYLLNLLRLTGENISGTLFAGSPIPSYFPQPPVGWVLTALAVIGGIVLLFRILQKKSPASQTTVVLFILMMIGISLSFFVGVDGSRTMRQYYNAYPFLVLIPAAGIYFISRLFKPRLSEGVMRIVDIGIVILVLYLSFSPTFAELNGVAGSGMATPQRWQALQWIKQNTPENSRVLYLYGFEHEIEMLAERIPLKGDMNLVFTQKNVVSLCNQQYPETYAGQWGGAFSTKPGRINGTFEYPLYNGFLDFPFTIMNRPGTNISMGQTDEAPLSDLDYVAFQYGGSQVDPCMAYFINESEKRGHKIVWKNDQFAVMEVAK